jgi:hypothetical protein
MNSNQRSQGNNQSDNGGNEKPVSSSRGGSQQSTDRAGSQTGNQQQSTPRGARHLSADEDLDDDTGLSNRANRQSADVEQGDQQAAQSNVGRRDDGTPD